MVLACHGVFKSEEELRRLSDCMHDGVRSLGILDAAKLLGFNNTRKYGHESLSLEDLKSVIQEGIFPIAQLRLRFTANGAVQRHFVVVVGVSDSEIVLHDPARGERKYSREQFSSEWQEANRLLILIRR